MKSDYGACQELIFYRQEFLCPNLDIVKTLTLLRHGTKWLYKIELDLLLKPGAITLLVIDSTQYRSKRKVSMERIPRRHENWVMSVCNPLTTTLTWETSWHQNSKLVDYQVFNEKVYTTRLCNDKEYSVRY